mmetsp:Transcript_2712/g.6451  ORF Transcript_2712/g.6451 Transcript_2712/m.6451 type:complete len:432 (+) Transcript_2712:88-1383(+)
MRIAKMNVAEFSVQLLLLLPVSFVSAAAVSYFVPRAGAIELEGECNHMQADVGHGGQLKVGSEDYNERIVQSQWEKQRRWTLVYKGRRKELYRSRISKLVLISVGAVAQVAATQVPVQWKTTTSFVGGVFVALGGYVKNRLITTEKVEQMVTSFYVAQAIKSEVYKYRAKCAPYNKNKKDSLMALRDNCSSLSKIGNDKRFFTMQKDNKPIPPDLNTKALYVDKRVKPRVEKFLIGRAKDMQRRGNLCSGIENALIGAGSVIGLSASQTQLPAFVTRVTNSLTGWAGAFTTISAAFANHHTKMKYEELAEEYFDTASQLREMVDRWPMNCNQAGDPGWDEQIAKMEDLIIGTTEEFAKKRSGNQDLTFDRPPQRASAEFAEKVWKPNVVCGDDESGSYPAIERATWLVENVEGMDMAAAKLKIMNEFPENF